MVFSDPLRKLSRETGLQFDMMRDLHLPAGSNSVHRVRLILCDYSRASSNGLDFFTRIAAQVNQVTDLILFSAHVDIIVSYHRLFCITHFFRSSSGTHVVSFRTRQLTHYVPPPPTSLRNIILGRFEPKGGRTFNLTAQHQFIKGIASART